MKGKIFTVGLSALILPPHCSSQSEWSSTLLPGLNEHCQLQQSLLPCSSPEKPCITSAVCNYSYCLPILGIGWKWEKNTFKKVISREKKKSNHCQHPFYATSISSALIMSQQVLVLNRCSFNAFSNKKGEKYGRDNDKENWQLFSHPIASVVLHLPCQRNNLNHQNNLFLRSTPQLYSCPRHIARLEPQNVAEDLHNVQIILAVHHLYYIHVLLGICERSVDTH